MWVLGLKRVFGGDSDGGLISEMARLALVYFATVGGNGARGHERKKDTPSTPGPRCELSLPSLLTLRAASKPGLFCSSAYLAER